MPKELMPDECRDAFEKWFLARFTQYQQDSLGRDNDHGYYNGNASMCWYAWQAAWNTRANPAPEVTESELTDFCNITGLRKGWLNEYLKERGLRITKEK